MKKTWILTWFLLCLGFPMIRIGIHLFSSCVLWLFPQGIPGALACLRSHKGGWLDPSMPGKYGCG